MKLKTQLWGLVFICFILFISCGGKLKTLKVSVEKAAEDVNNYYVQIKNIGMESKEIIENLFNNKEKYDLSTESLDDEFFWHQDYAYTNKDNGKFSILYYVTTENTGDEAFIEGIKQKIKLFQYGQDDLIEAAKKTQFKYSTLSFYTDDFCAMVYPWKDQIATVAPPGLPRAFVYNYLSWFANAAPEKNPGKKPVWAVDVFAGMAGEGWLQSISIPVYTNGDKFEGVITEEVPILEVRDKILSQYPKETLLILSSSLAVIGITQPAKDIVKLEQIPEFDYLKSATEIGAIADEYKLLDEGNSSSIKSMGNKIKAGETEFDLDIEGKQYTIVASKTSEVDLYIVGLVSK
jgi:hypothetical protein